jgi:hypothetical protein
MNATLSNVFLANLPKAICEMYKPIHMKQPNTVFLTNTAKQQPKIEKKIDRK